MPARQSLLEEIERLSRVSEEASEAYRAAVARMDAARAEYRAASARYEQALATVDQTWIARTNAHSDLNQAFRTLETLAVA